jgi:hypothetical protein
MPGNEESQDLYQQIDMFATLIFESISILRWPITTLGQMPYGIQKEITHCSEMNEKAFNIDMNMWNIARKIIEPISFQLFHAQSNPTLRIWRDSISLVDGRRLLSNESPMCLHMPAGLVIFQPLLRVSWAPWLGSPSVPALIASIAKDCSRRVTECPGVP